MIIEGGGEIMRIEALQEFRTLTKWMSLRKAADELHVTQSALSKRMAEIENETGLKLFTREANRLHLTDVGKAFAEEASYVVSTYEAALTRCRKIQKNKSITLTINEFQQNRAMELIYSLVLNYQKHNDRYKFEFKMHLRNNPLIALERNELNIALIMRFGDIQKIIEEQEKLGFLAIPIVTEPTVLWFKRGNHAVESLIEITLEDLENLPIITTSGEIFDYFGNALMCLFETEGKTPHFRTSAITHETTAFFLADYRDGVFLATEAMLNDSRLKARADLDHRLLEDQLFMGTTYAIAKSKDEAACNFLKFVSNNLDDCREQASVFDA